VPRGDGPSLLEGGLEAGERLDGRVPAWTLVRIKSCRRPLLLRHRNREDLGSELSGIDRCDSLAVAPQSVLVLRLSRDFVLFGHRLTTASHVEVFVNVPKPVAD